MSPDGVTRVQVARPLAQGMPPPITVTEANRRPTGRLAAVAWPSSPTGGSIAAERAGDFIRLSVRAVFGAHLAARDLHFFPEDALVAYDRSQTLRETLDGVELLLPMTSEPAAGPSRLRGVLTAPEA